MSRGALLSGTVVHSLKSRHPPQTARLTTAPSSALSAGRYSSTRSYDSRHPSKGQPTASIYAICGRRAVTHSNIDQSLRRRLSTAVIIPLTPPLTADIFKLHLAIRHLSHHRLKSASNSGGRANCRELQRRNGGHHEGKEGNLCREDMQ